MNINNKRLYLASEKDSVLGGVLAGLGNYFNVDPVLVRILFLIGVFILDIDFLMVLYFILWACVPRQSGGKDRSDETVSSVLKDCDLTAEDKNTQNN